MCLRIEKNNSYTFLTCLSVLLIFATVSSSIQSYKSRRLCNQYRERIIDAENTNRKFERTIEQCQSICGELGRSVERNISTARECIETIEIIRVEIQELENCLYGNGPSYNYQYWDNYFGIE